MKSNWRKILEIKEKLKLNKRIESSDKKAEAKKKKLKKLKKDDPNIYPLY